MRRLLPILLMALATPARSADMPGAADHPSIPRVAGAEIFGFAQSDYDAGQFMLEDEKQALTFANPEGNRTRILYIAKPGDTPIMAMKNYEVALAELGEVSERYSCRNDCNEHLLASNLWSRDNAIPTQGLPAPFYLLGFSHAFDRAAYRYAEVTTEKASYDIGVFASVIGANNSNKAFAGRTAILVEIVERESFEATLEFIEASEMQKQIAERGHIALYGIQFDHDSDALKPESAATLDEIVKILEADNNLALYVVGHTDDVGAFQYNQDLSLRRAASVVGALTGRGIDAGRLTPIGVGPAAPVGSNQSDEGRTLNRRVELVERLAR